MSDTQSSEEQEIKVQQQQQAKLSELMQKAKIILPDYTEESFLNIYQESFQNENVFMNKLHTILKQRHFIETQDNPEWIYLKKNDKKQPTSQILLEPESHKRQRYNFLLDKRLIERALKFERQSIQQPIQQISKPKYKEKVELVNQVNTKRPIVYAEKQKANKSYQQKRVIYKEKEQPNHTYSSKITYVQKEQKKPKIYKQKYVQKEQPILIRKYQEKKLKYKEKLAEKQDKSLVLPLNTQPQQLLINEQDKNKPPHDQQKMETIQKQQKAELKQSVDDVKLDNEQQIGDLTSPNQDSLNLKAGKVLPNTVSKINQSGQQSLVLNESDRKKLVKQQFEKSLNQNSYILKFIAPNAKLQRVSYLLYPDGTKKNVKTIQSA